MLSRRALHALSTCLFALTSTLSTFAHAAPLRIDASAERMRVDGALKEWRGARFSELGSGDDASVRYALATADQGLYVGAEIRDERLVTGTSGDALVLTLAMPVEGGAWRASELWLHPGESGREKARALLGEGRGAKRSDARIKIVEGPRAQGEGYVIEAFIPWALVTGAEIWEQGRGSLRFVDVDGKGVESTLASTDQKTASELPRLAAGMGQSDLLGSFVQAKHLVGVEPRYDFRSNVSGDAVTERVAIVDKYVVVYGPGYKRGETYGYYALPIGVGGGIKHAELLDLTGDGTRELAITLRQQNALGAREIWLAVSLDEGALAPLFQVELKKELKGGFVDSKLAIVTRGQRVPRLDVSVGRASGLDASTYREGSSEDAQPILLPWGEVESRSYGWDGASFAVVSEKKRAPTPSAASAQPAKTAAVETARVESPAQEPTRVDVLALFKRQQQLPASAKPSRTLSANVAFGAASEQLDVFGSTLVITGSEVADGTGYVTYGLPLESASDLLDVRAADVTGDRIDELLVRVRQKLVGSDAAKGVTRELLSVLRSDESGRLSRALLVEVARRKDDSAIENQVSAQAGALTIEPGRTKGWTQASYPFAAQGVGGAGALLLPWRDRSVRYRLEGNALVAHSQ
jgi:hypothetical protein